MAQGVEDESANSLLNKGRVEAESRNAPQNDNSASQFDDTISEVQSRRRSLHGPSHLDNQFELKINPASEPDKSADTKAHRQNDSLLAGHAPPPSDSGLSELSQLSFYSIQPVIDRGSAVHMTWEQSQPENPGHSTSDHPSQGFSDIEISSLDSSHMEPLDSSNHANGATTEPVGDDEDVDEPVNDDEDDNGVTMETADDSEDDSIQNRICSSLVRSAFDAREYLPLDQLCKILSPSVVHNLLLQHFDTDNASEYEREILGTQDETPALPPRRRRILAILVLIGQVKRLPKFIKHGVDDTALPFHFNHMKSKRRVTVSYMPHPQDEPRQEKGRTGQNTRRRDEPILKKFDTWPCRIAKEFTLWQSIIHVPFLQFPGDKIYFYDLYQDSTLPFDRYDLQSTGGYGSVRKVTIHPSHYNCHGNSKDQKRVCLAVKRLHTPNLHDYLQEVDLFDKLGAKIKDPLSEHLIPLQLTFKHGKDYFFMFPWADGNLKQLWSTRTGNPENAKQVCWFISQCSGIVSGLRRVHHITTTRKSLKTVTLDDLNHVKEKLLGAKDWGRHGDIKPENILWFENYNNKQNHLVISDFGLTQFNSAHSRSKVQQGQIQGFSGTYRPPDLHIEDQPISQNYDVWSLGCVFLEFVSWFLLGHDEAVFTFADERLRDEPKGTIEEDTFFIFENGQESTPKDAKLKKSVVKWIYKLHKNPHCSGLLHALLDLIQFTMLVPSSKDRWKTDLLYIEFQKLTSKCKESGFDSRGCPGSPNPDRYPHQPEKPQEQDEGSSKVKSQKPADIDTTQNVTEVSAPQTPPSSPGKKKTTVRMSPSKRARNSIEEEPDKEIQPDHVDGPQDEHVGSQNSRVPFSISDRNAHRLRGTETPPSGLEPVPESMEHQLDGSGSQFAGILDIPSRYGTPQEAFGDLSDDNALNEPMTNDAGTQTQNMNAELPEPNTSKNRPSSHMSRVDVVPEPSAPTDPSDAGRHLATDATPTVTHRSSRWHNTKHRARQKLWDWRRAAREHIDRAPGKRIHRTLSVFFGRKEHKSNT